MTDQQNQNKLNITQKYSSTFPFCRETQFLEKKNDILPQCAIAMTRRVSFRIRKKILLPTFLQTDAVDDSLIDLSSGPPGFLNDPIFTPSNAHLSIHSTTSYAYQNLNSTSAAEAWLGVPTSSSCNVILRFSKYERIQMCRNEARVAGMVCSVANPKTRHTCVKIRVYYCSEKPLSIRKFSPYSVNFSINVPSQKAPKQRR